MRKLIDALSKLTGEDLAGLAFAPGNIPAAIHLSETKPVARAARDRINDSRIEDAMKHEMHRQRQYVDGSYVDRPTPMIGRAKFKQPIDREAGIADVLKGNLNKYASNRVSNKTINGKDYDVNTITINPNADEAFLFHELGHIANRQSGLGKAVRDARDYVTSNPALKKALIASAVLAPGTATALIPGDDDAGVAMLASSVAAAPMIADEVMATNTALRMMETAGTRASLGQRGKLAGGLLSYLAPALGVGLISGASGNIFDEDI